MLAREKILESLLELSGRSATRSRPELLGTVLRSAIALTESEGSVAVVSPGRSHERFTLRPGLSEPEVMTMPRGNADGGRLGCIERRGKTGRAVIYVRSGDSFGSRAIFDAGAPLLPAFKAEPGFVF